MTGRRTPPPAGTCPHCRRERENLLTTAEASERMGLKPLTLVDWRDRMYCPPQGPLPWVKVGASVRYCAGCLADFIDRSTVVPRAL